MIEGCVIRDWFWSDCVYLGVLFVGGFVEYEVIDCEFVFVVWEYVEE